MSDIQKIFTDGFFYEPPSEKAPEFVKGKISILNEKFIHFLNQNVNDRGYTNIDILQSRGGKYYAQLNQYNAKKNLELDHTEEANPEEDDISNSIPFK